MAGPHTHEYGLTTLLPGARYCPACAARVCDALAGLEGVTDTECDLALGVLSVSRDPTVLSCAALESALRRIVVEAADGVAHAAYRITGLD